MLRFKNHVSLRAGFAALSLLFLAGASDEEGCGGEPPPPPPPCEDGFHLETICEPACDDMLAEGEDYPGMPCDVYTCHETCVPDEQCPDDTYPQWVCYDEEAPVDCAMGEDCGGGGPTCYLECVPIDTCGPGYHEEWICNGDPGMPEPLPEEDASEPPLPPEECYLTCVPDGCPPGTIEQTICTDVMPSDDPSIPPEEECWTECVPEESCPPGTHPEEVCEVHPDCSEPVCQIICVDDCPTECDPTLACGDALTCVDGLLYPSTCGPANCDEPIGVCEPGCDPTLACPEVITCVDGKLYPTGCGPANCDKPIGDCM